MHGIGDGREEGRRAAKQPEVLPPPVKRYYRPQLSCPSLARLKIFGSKYAHERYYRPGVSGTTAHDERYYRSSGTTAIPGAVLPALRDQFQAELPPDVSLRPNYYI